MKIFLLIALAFFCFSSIPSIAQSGSYSLNSVKIYQDGELKAERKLEGHILSVDESIYKIIYGGKEGDASIYKIVQRGTDINDKNVIFYSVEYPSDNGEMYSMYITIDSFFKLVRFVKPVGNEKRLNNYFEFHYK